MLDSTFPFNDFGRLNTTPHQHSDLRQCQNFPFIISDCTEGCSSAHLRALEPRFPFHDYASVCTCIRFFLPTTSDDTPELFSSVSTAQTSILTTSTGHTLCSIESTPRSKSSDNIHVFGGRDTCEGWFVDRTQWKIYKTHCIWPDGDLDKVGFNVFLEGGMQGGKTCRRDRVLLR